MDNNPQFQGDWNANKGYLQLLINYMAASGEYDVDGWLWREYKVIRLIYRITSGVIDADVTLKAKEALDKIKNKLQPTNIDPNAIDSQEAKNLISNYNSEAEAELEAIAILLISNIHKNNLILPKKQKSKGIKQLWEDYGLDDDNTEGTSEDN